MKAVTVQFTKWGGAAHWHFEVEPLGSDEHGDWFTGEPGISLQRADETPISKTDGFVMLVPRAGDWIAFWNRLDEIAVYVDVTTAPRMGDGGVTAVDLDLDVVRWRDGRVEVLDVDEFEQHRRALGYPDTVVRDAERTAQWLVDGVRACTPPFDATGASWLATACARWGVASD